MNKKQIKRLWFSTLHLAERSWKYNYLPKGWEIETLLNLNLIGCIGITFILLKCLKQF